MVEQIKMANQNLVNFIKEARNRGFKDIVIRNEMLKKGWPKYYVDSAFSFLDKEKQGQEVMHQEIKEEPKKEKFAAGFGSSITLFLDDELRTALEKRAKKNMLTLPEQVEDILRRSTLSLKGKKSLPDEKLDDKLVGVFSRRNTGQKTKKKKVNVQKKSSKKLTKAEEMRNRKRSRSLKKYNRKKRRAERKAKK